MKLEVLMFGRLADIAGNSFTVEDISDTDRLINTLHKTYPALTKTKYVIAVNKQVITSNTLLKEDSVVALLPPFSGG